MKYIFFGDIHGADLTDMINLVKAEQICSIGTTGDIDTPESMQQLSILENYCLTHGIFFNSVAGNHDLAILEDEVIMSKRFLDQIKKMPWDLHDEFIADERLEKKLRNFVYNDSDNIRYKEELSIGYSNNTLTAILIHGGLAGGLEDYPDAVGKEKNLWYRIQSQEDFSLNFQEMSHFGVDLMIRGHDHDSVHALQDENGKITIEVPRLDYSYLLSNKHKYIVNPGAYYRGNYIVLDVKGECIELMYKKFDRPEILRLL